MGKSGRRRKFIIISVIFLSVVMFSGALSYYFYNILIEKPEKQLEECEQNLKRIITALEAYEADPSIFSDNSILKQAIPEREVYHYPPSLNYLLTVHNPVSVMLKAMPVCPVSNSPYGYEVSDDYQNFTLWCGKERSHIWTFPSVPLNGCWPQYSPGEGVKFRPE